MSRRIPDSHRKPAWDPEFYESDASNRRARATRYEEELVDREANNRVDYLWHAIATEFWWLHDAYMSILNRNKNHVKINAAKEIIAAFKEKYLPYRRTECYHLIRTLFKVMQDKNDRFLNGNTDALRWRSWVET